MTTTASAPLHEAPAHPVLTDALRTQVREQSKPLDHAEGEARQHFPALGEAGLLDLGAPRNDSGQLLAMTRVLRDLGGECMSTAFSAWANRMAIEYLRLSGTDQALSYADELASGERLGITGMAAAFRDMAGCGTLELSATRSGDGWSVSGPIRWASNLYDDAILVTSARTDDNQKIIFAVPLASEGITVGKPFSLLALSATASSSATLTDVHVPDANVLTTDFAPFLSRVRPTFLLLQSSLCLGLAEVCLTAAREGLVGVNSVFTTDVDTADGKLALAASGLETMAEAVGTDREPGRKELLSLRLAAAELAGIAANLETRTAGGRGYASSTPTSRRAREAAFFPVQSPSEGQLRWELASC